MKILDCYPEDFGKWDHKGYGIPREVIKRVYVPLKPHQIFLSSRDYGFLYYFYYYELYGNLKWRMNDVENMTFYYSMQSHYARDKKEQNPKKIKYYERVLGI